MGNPNGNLAGFTDQSDPDWQQKVMAAVRARQRKDPTNRHKRPTQINVRGDVGFFAYVRRAAEQRGISIGAYARRAIGAFAAMDLDVPYEEVMRHCAAPTNYGEQAGFRPVTADDGKGWGDWDLR